jgi:hypothetical protein
MASFSLGESSSERVLVKIGHIRPNEGHDQWVSVHVSVKAGAFSGEYVSDFTAREIISFRNQLRRLYESLEGVAALNTCEGQLKLDLSIDARGAISLTGTAVDRPGAGNKLEFVLELDQSYLPQTISDLDNICSSLGQNAA